MKGCEIRKRFKITNSIMSSCLDVEIWFIERKCMITRPDPTGFFSYEIGNYISSYNTERPHQALWNFTPAFVHEVNNNTILLEKLSQLKYEAKMKRKLYWEGRTI